MEVGRIGQGGPVSIEMNYSAQTNSAEGANTQQVVTAVSTASESNVDNNQNLNEKEVKKAVDKLNNFLEDNNTYAEIKAHDKFKNDIMIKIIDKSTKQVIAEFPPKKILDMVAKMCEMVGVLFDEKA